MNGEVVDKKPFRADYTKPSAEILSDLIMASNNLESGHVPVSAYDMTPPVVIEDSRVTVTATAKRGTGFYGKQTFTYNRVHLNQIPGILDMGVDEEAKVEKLSDVLTAINARFKINLQPDDVLVNGKSLDVLDDIVEQEFDVVQDFSLTAKADSLVWMGDVAFTLTKIRQALDEVYQITLLDGLYAPLGRPPGYVLTLSDGYWRTTEEGYIRAAENFSPDIVEDEAQEPEIEQ